MSFYSNHILPPILDRAMRHKDFEQFRANVTRHAREVVLEVGFGSGLNLPHYPNISALYALEPAKQMYARANERIKHATFPIKHLCAPAERIPLPDNHVDTVVSTWNMCSFDNPQQALSEIGRVLKPHGMFLFIEHGASPHARIHAIQNTLTPIYKHISGNCRLNRPIDTLICDSGFSISDLHTFPLPSKPLAYMYQGIAVT